jgi:hypothetical protein
MEDSDSEQKEAFVMGWDGLLDALAERDEAGGEDFDEEGYQLLDDGLEDFDDEDGDDGDFRKDDDEDGFGDEPDHPLQAQAQELAMRAMDVIQRDAGPGTPSYVLITNLLQVSGKLAGVLNGRGSGYEPETGFVLAVLKRCLNWLNEAVGASQTLIEIERDLERKAALERIRSSAFAIRDSIVALRRELK